MPSPPAVRASVRADLTSPYGANADERSISPTPSVSTTPTVVVSARNPRLSRCTRASVGASREPGSGAGLPGE